MENNLGNPLFLRNATRIDHKVKMACDQLRNASFRVSSKGVPMIVVQEQFRAYSVAWFNGGKYWKIFYPYGVWEIDQRRIVCCDIVDVQVEIDSLEAKAEADDEIRLIPSPAAVETKWLIGW